MQRQAGTDLEAPRAVDHDKVNVVQPQPPKALLDTAPHIVLAQEGLVVGLSLILDRGH